MANLSIRNVHKAFDSGQEVLRGVSLEVTDGEFLILVGASGCGKSTLLNIVAGLETASSGDIAIGGRVVNHLPPRERDIAMVFQSYALYPSMTVRQNIAFGLKMRKIPKAEQNAIIARVSEMLQIAHLLDRKPGHLSGGQRQRVAMGRALARDPVLFLFDEPLSNLDAQLRIEMRGEIKLMHQRLGTTICYVTHDQIEAMTLGDRIAVMNEGAIQQVGSPQEVYDSPETLYVAGFIGAPAMNCIQGRLVDAGEGIGFELDTGLERTVLPLPNEFRRARQSVGRNVIMGLRPERIHDESDVYHPDEGALPSAAVRVEVVEPTGPDTLVFTHLNGQRAIYRAHPAVQPKPAQTRRVLFDVAKAVLFDPASGDRIR